MVEGRQMGGHFGFVDVGVAAGDGLGGGDGGAGGGRGAVGVLVGIESDVGAGGAGRVLQRGGPRKGGEFGNGQGGAEGGGRTLGELAAVQVHGELLGGSLARIIHERSGAAPGWGVEGGREESHGRGVRVGRGKLAQAGRGRISGTAPLRPPIASEIRCRASGSGGPTARQMRRKSVW